MRKSSIAEKLEAILKKLRAKDREAYAAVRAKMREVACSQDVEHYKNLRAPLQHLKRVHVMKSFVLVFNYDKAQDSIRFLNYDHHDRVYR